MYNLVPTRWFRRVARKMLKKTGYKLVRTPHDETPLVWRRGKCSYFTLHYCLQTVKSAGLSIRSVLDIGANGAQWSKEVKWFFPEAHFYLIEPQIEMEGALRAFCESAVHAKYFLAGAGPQSGETTLTVWEDLQGSSLLPQASEELIAEGRQRKIPIVAIDNLIQRGDIPIPELCKIDIQGYELKALEGAQLLFGKTEMFILEVSLFGFLPETPSVYDVVFYMHQKGYVLYDMPGFGHRPLDGALGQIDMCFVKEDSVLRKSHQWS